MSRRPRMTSPLRSLQRPRPTGWSRPLNSRRRAIITRATSATAVGDVAAGQREQRVDRIGFALGRLADLAPAMSPPTRSDDRQGQVLLVLELVIEGAARVPGRGSDVGSGRGSRSRSGRGRVLPPRAVPRASRRCAPSVSDVHLHVIRVCMILPMRLPAPHTTAQPWRIHALAPDFELEDVWALPTPVGPDDFARLVSSSRALDPSQDASCAVRSLFALRWQIGGLLGWDERTTRARLAGAVAARPAAGGPARHRLGAGLRRTPVLPAVPDRRRVRGRDRQPDDARRPPPRLGPDGSGGYRGQMAVLVKRNGLLGTAYMAAIGAVPAPDRVPAGDPGVRPRLACRSSVRRVRIAVFGDAHAHAEAFDAVIAAAERARRRGAVVARRHDRPRPRPRARRARARASAAPWR